MKGNISIDIGTVLKILQKAEPLHVQKAVADLRCDISATVNPDSTTEYRTTDYYGLLWLLTD